MSYSAQHPIDQYVVAVSDGRLSDAKLHLLHAVAYARASGSLAMMAGIAQRLATILVKQDDVVSAKILYEFSEDLDPGSLLAKLEHAKFLFHQQGSHDDAIAKCNEIIRLAEHKPFNETADDFGSEQYAEAALSLKHAIKP